MTNIKVMPNPPDLMEEEQAAKRRKCTSPVQSPKKMAAFAPVGFDKLKDGMSAFELIGHGQGYTYNDIIILPGQISFGIDQIDLTSFLTRKIRLKVSSCAGAPHTSNWDGVMAIGMALNGGLGVIHYNCRFQCQRLQPNPAATLRPRSHHIDSGQGEG